MSPTIRQLGEDALVSLLASGLSGNDTLLEGPGDDCAVVKRDDEWDTLLKADALVEGVHFTPDTSPELIGRKALARPLSDIAAMGGLPEHALVTLMVHPERSASDMAALYRGMEALARRYGVSIAGGETTSLPNDGLALSVALTGRVESGRAWRRDTARPGDLIAVSGRLGGSFSSGRHLTFTPRLHLARLLRQQGPQPTAAMDLSDGLGTDLVRLAKASQCGFRIEEALLPRHEGCSQQEALSDGEDYELLLTFDPGDRERLAPLCQPGFALFGGMPCRDFAPLTIIGVMDADAPRNLPPGWRHFAR